MGAVKFSRSYIRAKVLMHLQLSLLKTSGSIFVRFLGKKTGHKKIFEKFLFFP